MMFGWIIIIIFLFYFWDIKGDRYNTHNDHNGHHENALNVLKERFARSEISSEEFNERKRILEQ